MKEKIFLLYKKGLFHIVGSNVINKIIGFCSGFFLVRILSKGNYGLYSYSNNIISLFLIFSGLGVSSGILQFGSENIKDKNKQNSYLAYGFKNGIIINLILTIIILFVSIKVKFSIKDSNYIVALMSSIPILRFFMEIYQINFRIKLDNQKYSKYNTIGSIIMLITGVVSSIIWGLLGLVFSQYFAYILLAVIGKIMNEESLFNIKSKYKLKRSEKVEFFKVSLISCFNNGISQLLYSIDIVLIGYYISNQDIIATYKTATIIPFALNFIPLSLMTYIYPYFANKKDDLKWIKYKYKELVKYFGLFNLIISISMFIFAPIIIRVFFGEAYIDSIPTFRILSIGYFFASTFRIVSGNILLMLRKVKINFYISVISGILNICFNIIFIPNLGASGAAIATLMVFILTSAFSTSYLLRLIRKENSN